MSRLSSGWADLAAHARRSAPYPRPSGLQNEHWTKAKSSSPGGMLGKCPVAIASARWEDVDSLQTLLGFEEISYFVMFGYLGVAGPGPVSLDHLILRATRRNRPASDYGA